MKLFGGAVEAYGRVRAHLGEGKESLEVVTWAGCSQMQAIERAMLVSVYVTALRVVLLVVLAESA